MTHETNLETLSQLDAYTSSQAAEQGLNAAILRAVGRNQISEVDQVVIRRRLQGESGRRKRKSEEILQRRKPTSL